MRIAAIILSCLVLALSAGFGKGLPRFGNQTPSAQTQCCCDCGCCAENDAENDAGKNAANNDADAAGNTAHHGRKAVCPFCAGSLAKGLNTTYTATVPPMAEGGDSGKSLYVSRVYVPPFVGGIWQPPKSA